jgi:Holliday junction resolvase RusA-like endonuclease
MKWTLRIDGKILRKRAHLTTRKGIIFDPDSKIKIQLSDYIYENKLYPETPFKNALKVVYRCYFKLPDSLPQKEKEKRLQALYAPEKRIDGDNIAKLYNDIFQYGLLEGLVYPDDRFIVDLRVLKLYTDGEEYLEVEIEEIDSEH